MTEPQPISPRRFSKRRGLMVIRLLALLGVGLACYLLWLAVTDYVVLGCGSGSDCDYVLGSRWARWQGYPLAGVGALLQALILVASFAASPSRPPRWRAMGWSVMLLLSSAAVGAAAWFIYLQLLVLRGICPYCMAEHAAALALWIAVFAGILRGPEIFAAPSQNAASRKLVVRRRPVGNLAAIVLIIVGFAAAGGLATVQIFYPSGAYRLSTLSRSVELPYDQVPVIGPPDAPHPLFLISDYTCPHCRQLHGWLMQAQERYGRQITVIVLPIPVNTRCNRGVRRDHPVHRYACELNRLALAAWRADPKAFARVDEMLFASGTPLVPDEARAKIGDIIGAEALRRAEADPRVDQDLARDVDLFMELGAGPVPKLLIGRTKLEGMPASALEIFRIIEQQFLIRPVNGGVAAANP
jgi:uncharacterized membrane protein